MIAPTLSLPKGLESEWWSLWVDPGWLIIPGYGLLVDLAWVSENGREGGRTELSGNRKGKKMDC